MLLKQKSYDRTEGPVRKMLVLFVLPIIAGSLFQQLYTTADAAIVGRFAGKQALAAIDEMYEAMKPEMERHFERWPNDGSVQAWERSVERLRTWVQERPKYVVQNAKSYFGLSDSRISELFGDLGKE